MSKGNLEEALKQLNTAVQQGREFPDACYKISCIFEVAYEDLADAYDAQFSE
jgi:hypothetical protein